MKLAKQTHTHIDVIRANMCFIRTNIDLNMGILGGAAGAGEPHEPQ